MADSNDDSSHESEDQSGDVGNSSSVIDEPLRDPKKKELLLKKLGLGEASGSGVQGTTTPTSNGGSGKGGGPDANSSQHLTPSGTTAGAWPPPPYASWWFPHGVHGPIPAHAPEQGRAPIGWPYSVFPGAGPCDPGPSRTSKRPRTEEPDDNDTDDQESDVVTLLDEAEALELVEFDPAVTPKNSWKPPKPIVTFLEKHFNKSLSEEERESIMKDFPKPDCGVLTAPKLDEQVKEHLKMKGKDPHFGSEKSLYKLQEQLLDVAGPLTCLWADLLNKEARVSAEDTLLLMQRALVLLGSASHAISQERRKIAWTRINPKLKSLASEDYDKRETDLFGPGFLEKATNLFHIPEKWEVCTCSITRRWWVFMLVRLHTCNDVSCIVL